MKGPDKPVGEVCPYLVRDSLPRASLREGPQIRRCLHCTALLCPQGHELQSAWPPDLPLVPRTQVAHRKRPNNEPVHQGLTKRNSGDGDRASGVALLHGDGDGDGEASSRAR